MILDCLHWLLQSCCDCGHVSQIKEGRFHFPSTLENQQLNQILLLISAFHLNRFAHLLRGLIWRSLDYPSNHWCALPGNWRRARKSHAPCDWLLGIAVCETEPNRPWASLRMDHLQLAAVFLCWYVLVPESYLKKGSCIVFTLHSLRNQPFKVQCLIQETKFELYKEAIVTINLL